MRIQYVCEVCNTAYATEFEAIACENQPNETTNLKVGDSVKFHYGTQSSVIEDIKLDGHNPRLYMTDTFEIHEDEYYNSILLHEIFDLCHWIDTREQMPEIGDHVIGTDEWNRNEVDCIFTAFGFYPKDANDTNKNLSITYWKKIETII